MHHLLSQHFPQYLAHHLEAQADSHVHSPMCSWGHVPRSTPFSLRTLRPCRSAQEKMAHVRGSTLRSLGCQLQPQWAQLQTHSLTCLDPLPGGAAGGCRPGTPGLPLWHQTQAPKWCPRGNLPMNCNTNQQQQQQKKNSEHTQNIQNTLTTSKAKHYRSFHRIPVPQPRHSDSTAFHVPQHGHQASATLLLSHPYAPTLPPSWQVRGGKLGFIHDFS